MSPIEDIQIELLKLEYEKLKSEQAQRIGFRDNMLFVHLVSIGGIASWVVTNLEKANSKEAMLMIPWVCIIMGWTYIVNDYAVSRIGKYIREVLEMKLKIILPNERMEIHDEDFAYRTTTYIFAWEMFHRIDRHRGTRKIFQFMIDITTFIIPGLISIATYYAMMKSELTVIHWFILCLSAISLFWLLSQFFVYTDFKWGTESVKK